MYLQRWCHEVFLSILIILTTCFGCTPMYSHHCWYYNALPPRSAFNDYTHHCQLMMLYQPQSADLFFINMHTVYRCCCCYWFHFSKPFIHEYTHHHHWYGWHFTNHTQLTNYSWIQSPLLLLTDKHIIIQIIDCCCVKNLFLLISVKF